MTTKDKIFVGLEGVKELLAQKDVALLRRYHNGDNKTKPDEITEDTHEILSLKDTIEKLSSFLDECN